MMEDELYDFKVSDEAYSYLVLQRGCIAHQSFHGRALWEKAYRDSIRKDFEEIRCFIPSDQEQINVLDIGSGLGGIDVILGRHYGPHLANCTLFDGLFDPPAFQKHDKTFSNKLAALRFLEANGLKKVAYGTLEKVVGRFDLVLSLQAWGFHLPPQPILSKVKALCAKDATIIVDIRKGKPEWAVEFFTEFDVKQKIAERTKCVRYALTAK